MLQPLGQVDAARVAIVVKAIQKVHPAKCVVLPAKAIPSEAWYAPRQRYLAEKLLVYLREIKPSLPEFILGLLEKDIGLHTYLEQASGIMGTADYEGPAAVVSTARLAYGGASNELFLERLGKVASHEIGHCYGLEHCTMGLCLMKRAAGAVATYDPIPAKICRNCRRLRSHFIRQVLSRR